MFGDQEVTGGERFGGQGGGRPGTDAIGLWQAPARLLGTLSTTESRSTDCAGQYAPRVTNPSPYRHVFRWAWHRATEYRARFWIAAVTFSALASGIGAAIVLPDNPALSEKAAAAGVALAIAAILTVGGTYACALAAAPYQQRNELGRLLAASNASLTEFKSSPVTPEHAVRLREIARGLRASIESNRKLSYGADTTVWRPAFYEHFLDVAADLDIVTSADAAHEALSKRLRDELARRIMDIFPWNGDSCLNWLVRTIEGCSVTRSLGGAYEFNWLPVEAKRSRLFQSIPNHGGMNIVSIFVLRESDSAEVPQFRVAFEAIFRDAEGWPEAEAVGPVWERRIAIQQSTVGRLREIANMDPIRGTCRLCSGVAPN